MKKATVLKPFTDAVEGVARKVGDTFTVDDERADYLSSLKLVKAEIAPAQEKKKTTKKK